MMDPSEHCSGNSFPVFSSLEPSSLEDIDEERFRSDLERNSISSGSIQRHSTSRRTLHPPPPLEPLPPNTHEVRHARLLQQAEQGVPQEGASNSIVLSVQPLSGTRERRKPPMSSLVRPEPHWYNLFGLINSKKLYSFFVTREDNVETQKTKPFDALFYGSICSFISGLLLLMSFSSPYWLASWEETQSPFKNMGLWEMCFHRFRHPDYQLDHPFSDCHPIYGTEYRLIREKLLPGWLMVVQLFITLALIGSFVGQVVMVPLLLRYPLKIMLRFEHQFCVFVMACYGCTAVFIFLGITTFGSECWSRDWLLYPNFNYVSWSYAFAIFSCLGHIISTVLFYKDSRLAKERKEKTKALIMQMQPPGFASSSESTGHSLAAYM